MSKGLIYLMITIFGTVGSYIPTLFGDTSFFSPWSILGGVIGSCFGVWVAIKANEYI